MVIIIDRIRIVLAWILIEILAIIGWVTMNLCSIDSYLCFVIENGASTNPCSETYAGPHQDSEPETQSLQKFINQSSRHWDAYLTFHSYGQYWIYPWGFALHMPDDYIELVGRTKNKNTNLFVYFF